MCRLYFVDEDGEKEGGRKGSRRVDYLQEKGNKNLLGGYFSGLPEGLFPASVAFNFNVQSHLGGLKCRSSNYTEKRF